MESKEIEFIKSLVDQHEAISFDVFDTLVLRPFLYPADLFLYIEQAYDAPCFRYERQKAERIALSYNPTATFDEIYHYMPKEFRHLAQVELDLELQTIQPNKAMRLIFDYAKQQKKKIIIASDMYLSEDFIAQILKKNGYIGYDNLLVSSQRGKSKATGELFKAVVDAASVEPGKILHIGDSPHHDVEMPKKYGVNAYYYQRVSERFFANPDNHRIKCFYEENWNRYEASIIVGMMILKWQDDESSYNVRDYWEELGYCVGGQLCYSFVNSAVEMAHRKNLSDLFFLARDAYPLYKVFSILFPKSDLFAHYVYANRYLFVVNTGEYLNERQLNALFEYFGQFIPALRVDPLTLSLVEKEKLFAKHKREIAKIVAKNMDEYKNYIKSVVKGNGGIELIDSGAGFFSSQRLIERACGNKEVWGIYLQASENNECLYESLYHKKSLWLPPEKFHGIFMVLELLLTSPENPIVAIKDCKPVYQDKINPMEQYRAQVSGKIISGELDFARDLLQIFGPFNVKISTSVCFSLLRHYLCCLSREDVGYFSTVLYDSETITHSGEYKSLYSILCPFEQKEDRSDNNLTRVNLFGFLPFLKIVQKEAKTIWKFFGLPVIQKRCKADKSYIKVLGIPLFKVSTKRKPRKKTLTVRMINCPIIKWVERGLVSKLSFLGLSLLKFNQKKSKVRTIKIDIKKNTFILWSTSPVFHSEVDPGYAKYLSDLGYNVLVLRTYHEIQNSIWKNINLPRVRVVNLSPREIFNFLNAEKTTKDTNIKGILATTSLFFYTYGIGERQWVNRDVHDDLANLARSFDIPTPAELSLLKQKYQVFLEVVHNLDLQPLSSITSRSITLFTPNYHGKKTVMVNPHYFGNVRLSHPKNKVTTFVSVGSVGKDRKNVDALWNALTELLKSGRRDFVVQIFTYATDLNVPKKLKSFVQLYVAADYPTIFKAMEKADYFLALLDGENPVHDCYITTRTSGSFQLCYGFRKPMVIEKKFASYYHMSDANAITYDNTRELGLAMLRAIKQTSDEYAEVNDNFSALVEKIEAESLDSLRALIGEELCQK